LSENDLHRSAALFLHELAFWAVLDGSGTRSRDASNLRDRAPQKAATALVEFSRQANTR